jgi:hypothetical protein
MQRLLPPAPAKERLMTEQATDAGELQIARPLKTPRAAAVAGIVFSVLLITSLVLLELSTPSDTSRVPG